MTDKQSQLTALKKLNESNAMPLIFLRVFFGRIIYIPFPFDCQRLFPINTNTKERVNLQKSQGQTSASLITFPNHSTIHTILYLQIPLWIETDQKHQESGIEEEVLTLHNHSLLIIISCVPTIMCCSRMGKRCKKGNHSLLLNKNI